ncbi:glycosyltransferase family 2 protein [Hymenobacter nivis]|uniref:Glycosyltransferase family 2 protein n=1 Tax=Hymenobacter nivis TaxID=1850093 RepID=A0A502HBW6_9BACT|nr:glycosyltransferase family 2 protein [Hymenobacter nivis]TPG72259.1 glycosyltransferase family 2 protein [Hymenobacter nivis]
MKKISVIIPNYNHSGYLAKRIESVLNQTYSNIEIFILDDCSIDDSLAIINSYALLDKRISVVANEFNSGSTFKQWKKGLALCSSDLVWIAESDDYANENFLATLAPLLIANEDAAIAYSNSRKVDGNGMLLNEWSEWKNATFKTDRWNNDYINNGENEVADYLMYDCTINNTSAVLFRKKNLLQVIDKIQDFRYAGDWFAFIALCLKANIIYVSRSLNFFRTHTENVSVEAVATGKIFLERFKCISFALNNLPNHNDQKTVLFRQIKNEFKSFLFNQIKNRKNQNLVGVMHGLRSLYSSDATLLIKLLGYVLLDQLKK